MGREKAQWGSYHKPPLQLDWLQFCCFHILGFFKENNIKNNVCKLMDDLQSPFLYLSLPQDSSTQIILLCSLCRSHTSILQRLLTYLSSDSPLTVEEVEQILFTRCEISGANVHFDGSLVT